MATNQQRSTFFFGRRPVAVGLSGAILVLLGLLAVAGWVNGSRALASVHPDFIPMAPNTAACFLALGAVLVLRWLGEGAPRWSRAVGPGLAAAATLVALLRLLEYLAGIDLGVDGWLVEPPGERRGLAPVGRMAFFTAASFALAGAALLLLSFPGGRPPRDRGAGLLGWLTAASGAVFGLGYLYGSPLLSGQPLIPMALNTALGLVVLGGGVVCAAGPAAIPLRVLADGSIRARLFRSFLPFTLITVTLVAWLTFLVTTYQDASRAALYTALLVVAASFAVALLSAPIAAQMGASLGRAEERIRRLAAFPEAHPNVLVELDAGGRIGYVNPAGKEAFPDLAEQGLAHPALAGVREVVEGKSRRQGELSIGGRAWLQQAGPVLEGKAFHVLLSDVSEQRRTEAALRQSEAQLLQAQKLEAVGRLASGVAHDFNNLLTVISGYSELTLAQPALDPRVREAIEEVRKAGERASALTRQLLAFSRRQVLQVQVMDINSVVADMDRMIRRLIGADVDVLTSLAADLGSVKIDPGQLEQVLLNLVVNARDAMPAGGKLTIETGDVELDDSYVRSHAEARPGPHVMLAVSDSGCGMDAATLARIFEPFFTTKEKDRGTGLGLSTVYGIVKQCGGNIWVYSEPGRGSTFKVYLPRVFEAATVRVEAPAPSAPGGRESILLVEDDPALRALLAQVLRLGGHEVLEAGGGIESLGICRDRAGKIDLVIADLVMPRMGGLALARRLAAQYPELKVLFISGYTEVAAHHQEALPPGAVYLQKPFSPRVLGEKVRELLGAAASARGPADPAWTAAGAPAQTGSGEVAK